MCEFFFFFNDTATTEIYTLSLHDALPISPAPNDEPDYRGRDEKCNRESHGDPGLRLAPEAERRSEEHTSELQSLAYLVCRLLLEKKKKKKTRISRKCKTRYVRSEPQALRR